MQIPSYYSTSKNNRKKKNSKLNFCNFCFSLILAFKQTKEPILFQSNLKQKTFLPILVLTVKIFLGPGGTKLIRNILKKNARFGVLKQFGTTCRVPNFFLQKSLHPNEQFSPYKE